MCSINQNVLWKPGTELISKAHGWKLREGLNWYLHVKANIWNKQFCLFFLNIGQPFKLFHLKISRLSKLDNLCHLPEKNDITTRNLLFHWLLTLIAGQGEGQQLVKLAAVNSRPRSSQDRKQSPPVLTITELEHKLRKKVICTLWLICSWSSFSRHSQPYIQLCECLLWLGITDFMETFTWHSHIK